MHRGGKGGHHAAPAHGHHAHHPVPAHGHHVAPGHHHPHAVPVPVPVPVAAHVPHHHAPPAGTGPRVLFASFGGSDLTAKVEHMYKTHGGSLHIAPGQYCGTLGGDPFPGQYKDFVVVTVDSTNQSRVHVAADTQAMNVAPGPQTSSPRTPPHPAKEILLANYGGADVTAKCRQLFGPNGLHFTRQLHEEFGDPLYGTAKALVVVYLTTKESTPHRACAFWVDGELPILPREHHHHHHQPTPVPHHPPHHAPAPVGPRVLFASFGGSDLTAKVEHMYKTHGGSLHIAPGQYCATLGGDPFPGQYKDFVVVTVDSTNQSRVHVAADTQAMNVAPGPQTSTRRHPPAPAKEILLANYGGADVTAKCRELFGARGLQFERPLASVFGDTLPGTTKTLVVVYLTTKDATPHRACAYWEENEKPCLPREVHHGRHA